MEPVLGAKSVIRENKFKVIIIGILLGVLFIYSLFFLFLYWGFSNGAYVEGTLIGVRSGTFGDAFGTLNALFSGLAFSGVMITLLVQRQDLSDSQKQISRQQVESQFYNLLNLQQQVIQGFDLHTTRSNTTVTIQGRDCFRDWYRKLRSRFSPHNFMDKPIGEDGQHAYHTVLEVHQGDLGLYFRSLYTVFRFIEGSGDSDQKHFALVVRSLLSDFELVFLFYNCLSSKGERFMRFAEMYALFDNLDVSLLLSLDHISLIKASAYGSNAEALKVLAQNEQK